MLSSIQLYKLSNLRLILYKCSEIIKSCFGTEHFMGDYRTVIKRQWTCSQKWVSDYMDSATLSFFPLSQIWEAANILNEISLIFTNKISSLLCSIEYFSIYNYFRLCRMPSNLWQSSIIMSVSLSRVKCLI